MKEYKILPNATNELINQHALQGWEVQQMVMVPFMEPHPVVANQAVPKMTFHFLLVRGGPIDGAELKKILGDGPGQPAD